MFQDIFQDLPFQLYLHQTHFPIIILQLACIPSELPTQETLFHTKKCEREKDSKFIKRDRKQTEEKKKKKNPTFVKTS